MLKVPRVLRYRNRPFFLVSLGCCSGFHELLPFPPSATDTPSWMNSDNFIQSMNDAGIHRIAFVRHGNTSPSTNGIDFHRQLSNIGRQQAKDGGQSFGRMELQPYCHIAMHSPAPRTTETIQIFLKAAYSCTVVPSTIQLKPILIAYDGTMQPEGSALFKKIGYAPLQQYLNNKDNIDDMLTARRLLSQYAFDITKEIYDVAHEISNERRNEQNQLSSIDEQAHDGTTLLFIGHAIYLPAAALGVAHLCKCDDTPGVEYLLSSITKEVEGYLVDVRNNVVRPLDGPLKNEIIND